MQQKMLELQFLEQQAKQFEQQSTTIQAQIVELKTLEEALSDLSKVKEGKELFIPLGSGFFIKAKMAENKELLMNVGTKILLKKSYPDANELIEKQIKELEKALPQIEKEMSKIQLKGQALQEELQASQEKE